MNCTRVIYFLGDLLFDWNAKHVLMEVRRRCRKFCFWVVKWWYRRREFPYYFCRKHVKIFHFFRGYWMKSFNGIIFPSLSLRTLQYKSSLSWSFTIQLSKMNADCRKFCMEWTSCSSFFIQNQKKKTLTSAFYSATLSRMSEHRTADNSFHLAELSWKRIYFCSLLDVEWKTSPVSILPNRSERRERGLKLQHFLNDLNRKPT